MPSNGFEGVPPRILDAWRTIHLKQLKDPGPDWFSRKQLGELWGLGRSAVGERLRKYAELVECDTRQIENARGVAITVPVYRLKEEK